MGHENDLIKLYSGRILALASDIPHVGHLMAPDAVARARAPQCGSSVAVEVVTREGRVAEFSQIVKACVLGQAAASVVGRGIIGVTHAQIRQARQELTAMLTGGGPPPSAPFEELAVLRAAIDFKHRHASIGLSLEALDTALENAGCSI